jgi:hypothetical protein
VSGWLVAGVGLVYLTVAVKQGLMDDWPMVIVFAGYAISNVGFFLALK